MLSPSSADSPLLRTRVLVVDDDADLRASLNDMLSQAGFEVVEAADGQQMRAALAEGQPALVLLDLRLKGEDGLTLARGLRAQSAVPLIMISGQSDETDRVLLLELAADDFLVKPFSARELVARVRAVLRRMQAPAAGPAAVPASPSAGGELLRFGHWRLNLKARELVDEQGQVCPLTQAEYRLLETFVRHPGRVWTRDQLLEHTRSLDTEVFDRAVDVLILRLRRKIEPNPKHPQYIVTERGQGYLFGAPVTAG
ncbi:response regulator transcription factor [Ideonella sp. BN130291]|uniref:response regulator transcription factor n=1 Tax=Ideonella sp. BN130291 TaxID=3112940 RepID=UPI002E25CA3D|nr:response regulator transcription factor [Ideonella sp. BN130291]